MELGNTHPIPYHFPENIGSLGRFGRGNPDSGALFPGLDDLNIRVQHDPVGYRIRPVIDLYVVEGSPGFI